MKTNDKLKELQIHVLHKIEELEKLDSEGLTEVEFMKRWIKAEFQIIATDLHHIRDYNIE